MQELPLISVVIPVKNEALILKRCLESLKQLTYPKDKLEIIIADGLSKDNTREVALSSGAKVVNNEREIVSSGRNSGFTQAKGELVAFTDADCVFDPGWLKNSVKYFRDPDVGGVGGITLAPKEASDFEKAVDFIFSLAESFKVTSHRRNQIAAEATDDIPGCNAIYRRKALEQVMPVDENLLTAEDVWMNFCLKKAGYKLTFAPDVILWHHRRNSPVKFLRQIRRFAIGRLQVGRRNIKLLKAPHVVLGFSMPVLIVFAYFCLVFNPLIFLKSVLVFFVFVILACLIKTGSLAVSLNSCLVICLFIYSWSLGFLTELFFPLKDAKGK